MVIIRPMELKDVDRVSYIENENFSMPWSKESFVETCGKDDKLYLVCEVENKIVGYCGAWLSFDEADITNVAVDKAYRKQGFAMKLMTQMQRILLEKGVNSMFLEVRAGNAPARSLYNKLGFNEIQIRKNYYHHPTEDAVVMAKQEMRI